MVRRTELLCISVVIVFCVSLILYNLWETAQTDKFVRYYKSVGNDPNFLKDTEENFTPSSLPNNILTIVQQELIEEIKDYKFPKNKQLKEFTLISDGRPLRTLIISTWRSGSTFLGEILNAIPGNFYHYEPLLHRGIVQIRRNTQHEDIREAMRTLKDLFNCDYMNLDNYLSYGKHHVYLFTHNTRLWEKCNTVQNADFCWNATFLNQFCKLFPFQSMKTVRLRLELVEELLEDEK